MMLEAENGLIFSPRLITGYIVHVEDAISIDHLNKKRNIDGAALLEKLRGMSKSELVILHEWLNYYWYGKLRTRPSLSDYIS